MKNIIFNRSDRSGCGMGIAPLVVGLAAAACMLPGLSFADAEADKVLIHAGQPLIPAEAQTPVDDMVSRTPSGGVLDERAAFAVESASEGKLLLEATLPATVPNPVSGDAETVAVTAEASLDGEVNVVAVDGPSDALDQPAQVVTAAVDQNVYNHTPRRDYEADEGGQAVATNMGGNKEASAVIGEQDTRSRVPYALLLALFALIGLVPVSRRSH